MGTMNIGGCFGCRGEIDLTGYFTAVTIFSLDIGTDLLILQIFKIYS